jgi:hypothetical protein
MSRERGIFVIVSVRAASVDNPRRLLSLPVEELQGTRMLQIMRFTQSRGAKTNLGIEDRVKIQKQQETI